VSRCALTQTSNITTIISSTHLSTFWTVEYKAMQILNGLSNKCVVRVKSWEKVSRVIELGTVRRMYACGNWYNNLFRGI